MSRNNILDNQESAEKYFEAVWALKDIEKSPWPGQEGKLSLYDFIVFWHHRAMMLSTPPNNPRRNAAHSGPVFLPWHRYMLLRFENLLGEAIDDPDFNLPYWDWSEESTVLENSKIWTDDYLGQFEGSDWEIRFDQNSFGDSPFPLTTSRELRRYVGTWPEVSVGDKAAIQAVVNSESNYDETPYDQTSNRFRNLLEGWRGDNRLHNNIHLFVGGHNGTTQNRVFGDMILSTSPNDPTFFLHHCFIDKVWAAWQEKWSESKYVPNNSESDEYLFHRLDDPMHTFFDETVTPRDMLDVSEEYSYDSLSDITQQ